MALYDYITSRGDLADPVTRQVYDHHELLRLARICGRDQIDMAKHSSYFTEEINRASLSDALIAELYEILEQGWRLGVQTPILLPIIFEDSIMPNMLEVLANIQLCSTPHDRHVIVLGFIDFIKGDIRYRDDRVFPNLAVNFVRVIHEVLRYG
jgi:hypothetical protein